MRWKQANSQTQANRKRLCMQADNADDDSDAGSSLSADARLAWAAVLGFEAADSAYTCRGGFRRIMLCCA
jgi:hypothetical protein